MVKKTLTCSQGLTASRDPCPGFRSCFGGTQWSFKSCQTGQRCDGSKRVSLSASDEYLDCKIASGTGCMETTTGSARACCVSPACPATACLGTLAAYCEPVGPFPGSAWVWTEVDCALDGLVCVNGPKGPSCEAPGPACDAASESCQGSVKSYCQIKQAEVDCGKNPFRSACGAPGKGLVCSFEGSECNPEGFVDACDQGRLAVCVNGYKKMFDCRSAGFDTCLPAVPVAGFHARCGYFV